MLQALSLSLQYARFDNAAMHRSALARHAVRRWIRHALASDAVITLRIVDAAEGRALNRDYRKKDYPTNVLTFAYSRQPLCADLVLCAPVLEAEAQRAGISLPSHYAHLIIHGVLHAQGWEHETSAADARSMEAHETELLAGLGFPKPYR